VRARVSALALGLTPFLAATCHPAGRGPALMGRILAGDRALLERRMRREAALHARFGFKPIAWAHCEGDEAGTWVVGCVLEATAGGPEVEGGRWTVLELCRRGAAASREPGAGSGARGGGGEERGNEQGGGRWLWFGPTRGFPARPEASALIDMIQEHDPEALGAAGGGRRSGGGLAGRRRLFVQGPRARVAGAGGSGEGLGGAGGGWFVDLMSQEAVASTAQAALSSAAAALPSDGGARRRGGGARRRGGGGGGGAASAAAAGAVAQVVAALAARGEDGWFDMDAYLATMEAQGEGGSWI
jgi:hypothetical protein